MNWAVPTLVVLTLTGLSLDGIPTVSFAVPDAIAQTPPSVPGPQRVALQGLGACGGTPILLTALVPEETGKTTADRPSFWFYVPYGQDSGKSARFSLVDRTGNVVYRLPKISLPATPGVVEVQIPTTVPPLENQASYRWYFAINDCDPAMEVFGWVQKVKPTDLNGSSDGWFDQVTALGQQLKQKSGDTTIRSAWKQLLGKMNFPPSSQPNVADQPIMP